MMQRLTALIGKDLRMHRLGIAGCHAMVVAVVIGMMTALDRGQDVLAGFVLNVNGFCLLLWAEWFVSREKTKGSFAWLRTLPIGAAELVASKLVVGALCVLTLWTATSLAVLRTRFFPDDWAIWLVLLLALQLVGAVFLASRWLLPAKLAAVGPLVTLAAVVFAASNLFGQPALADLVALWETTGGKLLAAGVLALLWGVVAFVLYLTVAAVETRRIVE